MRVLLAVMLRCKVSLLDRTAFFKALAEREGVEPRRLLRRRGRFPDRDVDRISRRGGRFLGLDAGERNLGSAAGRAHYSRLAHDRRLGTGPSRRHQPDHLRLGDRDDSACRAQCRLGRRGSRGTASRTPATPRRGCWKSSATTMLTYPWISGWRSPARTGQRASGERSAAYTCIA